MNEAFVRRHYPDGQALGRRLKGGDWNATCAVDDHRRHRGGCSVRQGSVGRRRSDGLFPYAQNLWMQTPYVIVKADGDPSRLVPAIRQAVKAIDANLPLRDLATMNERLRTSMIEPRLRSRLFALIAGLALALAVTGIYGVHGVSREPAPTRDGNPPRARCARERRGRHVVAAGLRLVGTGIVLGTIGAVLMSHSLAALLFQVEPRDPAALITVAALLATAALFACAVPAARTARIDPASVLRDE